MFNLTFTRISIECPRCGYEDDVQFVDIKSEKSVYCHNCKVSIQLKDENASVHTGIRQVSESMRKLDELFNKIGR